MRTSVSGGRLLDHLVLWQKHARELPLTSRRALKSATAQFWRRNYVIFSTVGGEFQSES